MISRDVEVGLDGLLGSLRKRGKMSPSQEVGGDTEIGGCGAIGRWGNQ